MNKSFGASRGGSNPCSLSPIRARRIGAEVAFGTELPYVSDKSICVLKELNLNSGRLSCFEPAIASLLPLNSSNSTATRHGSPKAICGDFGSKFQRLTRCNLRPHLTTVISNERWRTLGSELAELIFVASCIPKLEDPL